MDALLKSFTTHFTRQPVPKTAVWKERAATSLGAIALLMIVVMAFPLVIILFLWIQYRRFFPKKNTAPSVLPTFEWATFLKNEQLELQRKVNHGLEIFAEEDPALAEELEFEEFVAYGIRSIPAIQELEGLFFDHEYQEALGGVFLRGLSPVEEREQDPIYYLDYLDKSLQIVSYIPGNSMVEIDASEANKIVFTGRTSEERFTLTITKT